VGGAEEYGAEGLGGIVTVLMYSMPLNSKETFTLILKTV
jgi:hypothetical protein